MSSLAAHRRMPPSLDRLRPVALRCGALLRDLSLHVFRALAHRGNFLPVKAALCLVWIYVVWWGEKHSFEKSTSACHWDAWEKWPSEADPHRVVLLTDPQLIDPHTYPGRPWPLDKLTFLHTDQYLRRNYRSIRENLDPDSVIFLGDLFDGGREWWTGKDPAPVDKTWRQYGGDFWLDEYKRWSRIFINDDGTSERPRGHPRGDRRMVASLPGNHDLGIADGVRLDTRDRFSMFFGDTNRVDVIGNHSFVSIDSVSLLARSLEGSSRETNRPIWDPPNAFLNSVQRRKAQALERYLNEREGLPENPLFEHRVFDIEAPEVKQAKTYASDGIRADVPTILLTHVPLFRAKGAACGPLREKYPSAKTFSQLGSDTVDERNSITLGKGYQYQNVLDQALSKDIIDKIGNVAHVFSGDDHDYCEIVHRGYTSNGGGVKEITVKSMSWAMGVRKPGFLLVSLWNPIDAKGQPLRSGSAPGGSTIQTQLCLLPDTLGTFVSYGEMFALTLVVLLAFAWHSSKDPRHYKASSPLLPVARKHGKNAHSIASVASSNYMDPGANGLAVRPVRGRSSPSNGWAMAVDRLDPDPVYSPLKGKFSEKAAASATLGPEGPKSRRFVIFEEFQAGILQVAFVGFSWYYWQAKHF